MDILIDALLDSIKVVPFLFLVYLLINYLEQNTENRLYRNLTGSKWLGPIVGSTLGCLPQCGFSVVGANLYSKRLISVGTLLAIFISTSDEAVPILFAHPGMLHIVVVVMLMKVVIALVMGLAIDGVLRLGTKGTLSTEETTHCKMPKVHCSCGGGCHAPHEGIWKRTLLHTLKVFAYILVINVLLNGIIAWIGEETLGHILLQNSMWQPALAGLVGLIPNCAASIVLTEMYVAGSISLGALIAGLSTGAGIGLVVLFKANKNLVENLKIVGVLYLIGTAFGMLIQMIS